MVGPKWIAHVPDNKNGYFNVREILRVLHKNDDISGEIYLSILVLAFSAFFLWMYSISTRLFLNTLPFAFMYKAWYRCLSIFLAVLYLRSSLRSTLCLCTQSSYNNGVRHFRYWQAITVLLLDTDLSIHKDANRVFKHCWISNALH